VVKSVGDIAGDRVIVGGSTEEMTLKEAVSERGRARI